MFHSMLVKHFKPVISQLPVLPQSFRVQDVPLDARYSVCAACCLYSPTSSFWSTVTKEDCEKAGCKCSELFNDPTMCSSCGECLESTDCSQTHPVCKGPSVSYGSQCVECMESSDCTSPSNPVCNGLECKPTCSTSNYQCKTGMRV